MLLDLCFASAVPNPFDDASLFRKVSMQPAQSPGQSQSASSLMVQVARGFASATESSRTRTSSPLTVLVVEDDPSLLSLTAYVFGKKGHHVLTDVDAFGALALLRSHSVDLLFTDIDLAHGTNGVTLARDARALRSDLPVAYTSGRVELSADQMVPGSVFLPKPYRLAEVIGLPGRLAKFELRLDEHHSGKGIGND